MSVRVFNLACATESFAILMMGPEGPHFTTPDIAEVQRRMLLLPRDGEGLVPVYLHVIGLRQSSAGLKVRLGAFEGAIVDEEGAA